MQTIGRLEAAATIAKLGESPLKALQNISQRMTTLNLEPVDLKPYTI